MEKSTLHKDGVCLMRQSKTIASCGMAAALSVVVMIIGGILGLGMYASPMIAGFLLPPIGKKFGVKYEWTLWGAVSLLCFILVPNAEQNLMYLCFFGLYPLLYPHFEKLKGKLKWVCKFLYFNVVVIAVEALVMLVLVPESMGLVMTIVLLIMGNFIFLCYDLLIGRSDLLVQRYLGKLKH